MRLIFAAAIGAAVALVRDHALGEQALERLLDVEVEVEAAQVVLEVDVQPLAAGRPRVLDLGAGTRIELRMPDPSCNPYIAFAAMLMAGIDGIQNRIDPGRDAELAAPARSRSCNAVSSAGTLKPCAAWIQNDRFPTVRRHSTS